MNAQAGINALVTTKGRWMAPVQVPFNGTFWMWHGSTLTLAGGMIQLWQRNTARSEPGMMETVSSQAIPVVVITYLKEIEATGRANVIAEVIEFNKAVWKACKSGLYSYGPAEPSHVKGTRDKIAEQLYDAIEVGVGEYKPFIAYADVDNPYTETDAAKRPYSQYPAAFHTEDVSGILAEPRDDPDNPPSWMIAEGTSLQKRMRAQMDSILDDPRQTLADLPQLAATVGVLVALMLNENWCPRPLRRKPGDAEDPMFDALYDQISTHR